MSYSSVPITSDNRTDLEYPHDKPSWKTWNSGRPSSKGVPLASRAQGNNITEFSRGFTALSIDESSNAKTTSFSYSPESDSLTSLSRPKRIPTNERPKAILSHSLRPVLVKLLPHVLAALVIVAIVQLSFQEQYWMDLVPPNQHISPGLTQGGALNALQLAAKLVELIILSSLSFIVMYTAQQYLLGKSGLPLGLMASPHQVVTGELLRRNGFWSAWNGRSTFTGASPWVYTPYWLLCLLATLLVAITGPSAAIAVIPSLDWFPVDRPFTNDPSPYYIFNATTELWPSEVTQDSLNGKDSGNECLSGLSTAANDCPAGGFRVLYEWGNNLIFDNLALGSNISTPNDRGDTRRLTNVRTCAGPSSGRATGMSITSAVSNALVGYWNFARNNFNGTAIMAGQPRILTDSTQTLYSPRVDVICGAYTYDSTTIKNQREMVLPTFDSSAPPTHVPDSALDDSRPLNTTDFIFLPRSFSETGISINTLATVPLVTQRNGTWVQATNMIPCSIYAQWAPVSIWYEPNTQDQVSLQPLDTDTRCLNTPTYQSSSRTSTDHQARNMTISMRYAESMNQNISFTDYNRSAIAAILDEFLYESTVLPGSINFRTPQSGSGNITTIPDDILTQQRADVIAAVTAGYVTDSLSRIAAAGHYPYSAPFFIQSVADTNNLTGLNPISTASGGQTVPLNITQADVQNYIRLNPSLARFGYGYKYHGNTTAKFGIAVLLVHLCLAVSHSVLVLYKTQVKKQGIGNAFDTVGEIVAMALNSRVPKDGLGNTCGGISEGETWREIVAVREVGGGLEMVVGDEVGGGGRARVGVRYGDGEEG